MFVSKGDSVAERRTLELGIEQGDRIEVLSGLQQGDHIIITGQQGLEDNGRISVASGALFQTAEQNTIKSGTQDPEAVNPARVLNQLCAIAEVAAVIHLLI